MSAKIIRMTPQPIRDDLVDIPADKFVGRILRLQELLELACSHMLRQDVTVWPKAVSQWYEDNVPDDRKVLTYDEAVAQLTPEQRDALNVDMPNDLP